MTTRPALLLIAVLAALPAAAAGEQTANADRSALLTPAALSETAPDTYRARFDTSKGVFVIEVHRAWAPIAADRFYNLVKNGFYDEVRFLRVIDGFMAQFGIHGDPAVTRAWRAARIRDEPVVQSNLRGYVTFAQEQMPNSRDTQVFISYRDNSSLDRQGFAPFGQVVSGMEVVDQLYNGYGNDPVRPGAAPRVLRDGNAFLEKEFPLLDYVKTAAIE